MKPADKLAVLQGQKGERRSPIEQILHQEVCFHALKWCHVGMIPLHEIDHDAETFRSMAQEFYNSSLAGDARSVQSSVSVHVHRADRRLAEDQGCHDG